MTSLTSFTLFPLLPPELRLQVYHHACHPRVTTLSYLPTPRDTYHCPTPPPTLLHISQEARAEGLRLYAKCLLPPSSPLAVPNQHPPLNPTEPQQPQQQQHQQQRQQQQQQPPPQDHDRHQPRKYFYHHPHLDTLYLPRPSRAADPLGLGYADWAREFAAGTAVTATAVVTAVTATTKTTTAGTTDAAAGMASGPGMGMEMEKGMEIDGLAGVVRRLAVDYVPAEVRRPWEVFGKVCLIRGCPLLEEAYLVVQVGGHGYGGYGGYGVGGQRQQQQQQQHQQQQSGNAVGPSPATPGGRREVEFVDPAAGDAEIVRIMERVRASFRVELGDGAGEAGEVGSAGSAGWGGLGKEGAGEGRGRGGLELVPKAMVLSPWGCRHVACTS